MDLASIDEKDYIIDIVKEIDDSYSIILYIPCFIKDTTYIMEYLESQDDFKSGFVDGVEIKRQQKWISENQSINDNWKVKHERWQPYAYDSFLIELQNKVCNRLNEILGVSGEGKVLKSMGVHIPLEFNCILINKYRNGNDFISAHKDSEEIFGNNPTIVSLSIGDSRKFIMKRILYDKSLPKKMKLNRLEQHLNREYILESGSLLIMAGACQKYYSHEVEKKNSDRVRYNMTFRHK